LWRPFPFEEIRNAVNHVQTIIVVDRALSPGGPGGPVASEIRAALYDMEERPKVVSFVGGLGGKVISEVGFLDLLNEGIMVTNDSSVHKFELV
jgi:pyruvate ferredoxin oxidoreductase alpha subunit